MEIGDPQRTFRVAGANGSDRLIRFRIRLELDFANLYTLKDTVVSLQHQIKRFENWVRTCAPLLIPYDEICFDTITTITRIAERIGVGVDAEAVRNKFMSDPRVIGQFNKGEKRRFEHEMEAQACNTSSVTI